VAAVGMAGAQKQGGSITLGTELDVPRFDPVKVGVFGTAAQMAASLKRVVGIEACSAPCRWHMSTGTEILGPIIPFYGVIVITIWIC
jgi:hypothetical protein